MLSPAGTCMVTQQRDHATPWRLASAVLAVILAAGCSGRDEAYDTNVSVPPGDPPFTALATSWVIDNGGALRPDTVREASGICQRLQDDGIAEVAVLVQPGVRHPSDYATHYGRWLRLGRKGLSTEGGNNGLVWLIRPDAEEKMTYSTGRGLPRLTSTHALGIMNQAKEYFNFGNYDEGVKVLVRETDKTLRALYGRKGDVP
jgi:uncharacterized membrane protein YgcG